MTIFVVITYLTFLTAKNMKKQTNKQTSKTLVSHEDIIKKVLDLMSRIIYWQIKFLISAEEDSYVSSEVK